MHDSAFVPHDSPDAPPPLQDRRDFIRSAALIAAGLMLARDIPEAAAVGDEQITTEIIARAERLSGLRFTDDERAMMTGPLTRAREHYERLRALELPNAVPPALQFRVHSPPPPADTNPPASNPGPAHGPRPGDPEALAFLSVTEMSALIEAQKLSPVELTELYIDRLKRLGPKLLCVVSMREPQALREAERAEAEIRSGRRRGPLHGIPWGAKDLLATRDVPTTWGAEPFRDQQLDFDAAVVERLADAGAILVAKLSLGALAQGDVWFAGRTLSPWDTRRGSSGSSAGPAAATAAGLVAFTIGSETHGSIVMPSTVCGVSGLRPTFGRVSRHGAMNLSFSMDKIGPMCRSAEDCAWVFASIHGRDERDASSLDAPFNWPPERDSIAGKRIGFLEADFEKVKNPDDAAINREALDQFARLGAELVPMALPDFPVDPLRMILTVEAAAAFDDLTLSGRDKQLGLQHPLAWPNTFRIARMVPAVEYLKAQQARTVLMQRMEATMREVDALVTPSTTGETLPITNLTGHPAVVIPSGFVRGTPRSITIVGRLFEDDRILAFARAFQGATAWHTQHPILG